MNPHAKPNRLLAEKSPYLQQHAYNPVDWFPWGEEAFEKARSEDKPIFLSIGYSTCHWCHVMERESFESLVVADFLNEHFVSIKVDREERPDIDAIYMAAVQAISGSGGWPMSVFVTPNLKPFFAGTYFPPQPAYGRPSFIQLLARIYDLWMTEREALEESSDAVVQAIKGDVDSKGVSDGRLSESVFERCFQYFEHTFDKDEGGFGNAPKFPRPVQFEFLFRYFKRTGNAKARDMSLFTLRKMAMGGMHDHLGGGFHRYSVDKYWRVSHFEKMLYDQAQLIESYLDAYQITGDNFFEKVVRDTCDYVMRDLSDNASGFYSAEDADSEGEEGTFYVWKKSDLDRLLASESDAVARFYGITDSGNFEHGKNVLYVRGEDSVPPESLERAKQILFEAREKRERPHLDDKVLASWNGLMIGALARSGAVLNEPKYLDRAKRAAEFVWTEMRDRNGMLLHRWRAGESRFEAYLDTYAFLIKGLIELYEATGEVLWIEQARELQEQQNARLWDEEAGGYFMSAKSPDVIVRSKSDYDGAEPSGNSIAAMNLLKLALIFEDDQFRTRADKTIAAFAHRLNDHPFSMPALLAAADWQLNGAPHIILAGEGSELERMRQVLFSTYLGNFSLVYASKRNLPPGPLAGSLVSDEVKAYLCKDFTCDLPIASSSELVSALAKVGAAVR